jgi:hypothetical protein
MKTKIIFMEKENSSKVNALNVQPERAHFNFMLAKNPNYFGNIPGSDLKPNFKLIADASFEELTCVGYNPDTANMEATFAIKRTSGYSGDLCTAGSLEYIRFYLDFHDGAGFIDQGSTAVNVHDIPAETDCTGQSIFPITYVATLQKTTAKFSLCSTPVLPTLRAILSWSSEPPAASPAWNPVWGSVLDADIQIKPSWKFPIVEVDLSAYFELAASSPNLSSKQLTEITGIDINQFNPKPVPHTLSEIVKKYTEAKVPASRFALKTVKNLIESPSSPLALADKLILTGFKIDVNSIIDQLGIVLPVDAANANVDYEQLKCVGLDYNIESLVATIEIKKNLGYGGDLCSAGSTEYIAFWVDWGNDQCAWEYINTVQLNTHDIKMVGSGLYYSVSLPIDTTFHKKLCTSPNVVRVRGVLSWDIAPSTTDPNKLEYYGNRVDTHVQIKPGAVIEPGDVIPLYTIIGGIDVDHVDDTTGLTIPGSIFAFNALPVPTGAPFGGEIVINGPSFAGYKYRIKVTDLNDGTSYYVNNSLSTVGFSLVPPYSPWFTQVPDIDYYYDFLPLNQNLLNVLARFTPGTEDQLLVEIEVEGIPGTFGKTIQMDNTLPVIQLLVNDGGDCTHYKKGDTITGDYYVYDEYILSWSFATTWGGDASGNSNTPALPGTAFSVVTPANAYPCGGVSLSASDKTIIDSQALRGPVYTSYNICLQG